MPTIPMPRSVRAPKRAWPTILRHGPASLLALLVLTWFALSGVSAAQTGGEGGISGTVVDATGAAIPHATVVATNQATGVTTTRESTGAGLYTISPVLPGIYTVSAKATGFQQFVQKNLQVDAMKVTGLNITLQVGSESTQVEVTTAPPQLETTNATISMTIENTTYAALPLAVSGAMRDPTAFGELAPGAQSGARLPLIGGTGNYLGQLYLDGLPAETVSQQGDNRLVSQAVSVDAVDQMQVLTSTPPAEYSGAGAENFTMKSGGLAYHGQVSDFVRNTAFDAWPFLTKSQTSIDPATGATIPAPKPVDHQNEFSASFGGHVPGTKRVFFFVAYDRYHDRGVRGPVNYTVPTSLEKSGDFTQLNCASNDTGCLTSGLTGTGSNNPAFLYDPTTTSCSGGVCTRQPFVGLKNGVPTYNVIPTNMISPIAKAMQSFLPNPSNTSTLVNNYTGSQANGFDNHAIDWRVDFDLSEKQRISTVGAMGYVNYLNNYGSPYLPQPYTGGDLADIFPKVFDIQDTYTFSNSLVNQLKYGFVRFFQNIHNSTQGISAYELKNMGVTNLPPGQAGEEFPGVSFATTSNFGTAVQTWTGNSNSTATQLTTPNNFTIVDNLQWVKGRHSLTFGISIQWQQINNANPATETGILSLPFTAYSTAPFSGGSLDISDPIVPKKPGDPIGGGYSYASFLLGAVGGDPGIGIQPLSEVGGRYMPIAPYVEDTWKITPNITLDAGIRWDYLPPYHEVRDRWSFLNPNLTNPITGTPGELQFAGNYGGPGVSCGCRTPVKTYWKNFGPRVGLAWSFTPKTVLRAGIGRVFSQGGGVGGRGGNFAGTGQLGFNPGTATAGAEVTNNSGGALPGPSFYLNTSTGFQSAGLANNSLFGPGFTYPTAPAISAASQTINTGNYLDANGNFVNASSVAYADPYFSGRAPDFTFYNLGIEQAFTNALTIAINYVGNQSHHLLNSTNGGTGAARGYWSNQLNPRYLAGLAPYSDSTGKIPLLDAAATPANVAIAQAAMPGINIPAYFQQAATKSSKASIAQGLVAFPQYSGVNDIWGANVGNFSYNSLQITADWRFSHGLRFSANYTWSQNIGDDGTFRSGFDIPAAALSGHARSWHMDRIERSKTTVSSPQLFHAYGLYDLPFGKGMLGGNNALVRAIVGGFQLSGIYTYSSGTPMVLTSSKCSSTTYPLQGQCMPDVTPGYVNARINGGFGSGPNGRTTCNLGVGKNCTTGAVKYFDSGAFKSADPVGGILLIGNAPRTEAFHLTNPAHQNLDLGLHRRFNLHREANLELEADLFNALNHTNFGNPNSTFGSSAFGTITSTSGSPRQLELAAHIHF